VKIGFSKNVEESVNFLGSHFHKNWQIKTKMQEKRFCRVKWNFSENTHFLLKSQKDKIFGIKAQLLSGDKALSLYSSDTDFSWIYLASVL
jgi:hypothetical protein